jgi:hypothetical protein
VTANPVTQGHEMERTHPQADANLTVEFSLTAFWRQRMPPSSAIGLEWVTNP